MKRYRPRVINLPCGIASDGTGGIVLYAPVELTNVVDLVQPTDPELGVWPPPPRLGIWKRMITWMQQR